MFDAPITGPTNSTHLQRTHVEPDRRYTANSEQNV